MATWGDFASALPGALGAPASQGNIDAFLGWFLGEQPPNAPNAAFNPLNIQEGDVGYGQSGSGQTNYGTFEQGVAATARVIAQSNMAGISAALAADAGCENVLTAVEQSPWAEGHYGYALHNNCATIAGNRAFYMAGQVAGVGGPVSGPPPVKPPPGKPPSGVGCVAPFTF